MIFAIFVFLLSAAVLAIELLTFFASKG